MSWSVGRGGIVSYHVGRVGNQSVLKYPLSTTYSRTQLGGFRRSQPWRITASPPRVQAAAAAAAAAAVVAAATKAVVAATTMT
jgi:hypothetical protein